MLKEFMGHKVEQITDSLFKVVGELICTKNDIRYFPDFTLGVLYSETDDENLILVRYIKLGYEERHFVYDDVENGLIPEGYLTYIENVAKEMGEVIGGIYIDN